MPPHPHDHQWYFHSEGRLSPYRSAELFKKLASDVLENRGGKLGDVKVTLPEEVHVIVRYERKPKGELVLKAELTWRDSPAEPGEHPITQLLDSHGSRG